MTPLVIVKPPKKIGEMTDEERRAFRVRSSRRWRPR